MKIELQALEGQTDGYSVRLCEDDGDAEDGTELGHVHRSATPNEWSFVSVNGTSGETPTMTLTASTVDELRECFKLKFSAVDIPANRIECGVMERFAEAQLSNLRQLANHSNSTPGFLAALADTVGELMVEDFGPDYEKTLKLFDREVRKSIAEYTEAKERRERMSGKLKEMFGGVIEEMIASRVKKDEPIKH